MMDNAYNQCFRGNHLSEPDVKRQRELTAAHSGRLLFANPAALNLADQQLRGVMIREYQKELEAKERLRARKPLRTVWKRKALNRAAR
jgi:hypothetical protein